MNHRIANAHVVARLWKYERALPHADCKCCGVSVASRRAQSGAVSVGERIAACLKSCDCPADESRALQDEWKGWVE
jgi:hypothetical protein